MTLQNPKDKSRTSGGKTYTLVRKHTKAPDDQGGWGWLTREMLESPAFCTLSINASKALFRILVENIAHGSLHNGKLIVTHSQFIGYGVTGDHVGDALDELAFKGWLRFRRGRAGTGTSHPNIYRLTFLGDYEGAAATNEWRKCTVATAREWTKVFRTKAAATRNRVGRKKKSPLRDHEIRPLRDHEIRPLRDHEIRSLLTSALKGIPQ
jgi:hypothetical protein